MSTTAKPVFNAGSAFISGKWLVVVGGNTLTTSLAETSQVYCLDLSKDWPAASPVILLFPNMLPSSNSPTAIAPDGTIYVAVNNTIVVYKTSWATASTNSNLGSQQGANNNTQGLKAVINPNTLQMFIPGGSLSTGGMVIYDLKTGTFSDAPMFSGSSGLGYAALYNAAADKLVVLDTAGALHLYSSGNWTIPIVSGAIPSPRSFSCFVSTASDELILFGGYSRESGSSMDDLYYYNMTTNVWTRGPSSTVPISQGACAYSNGQVIVNSGVNSSRTLDVMNNVTLILDRANNKWVRNYFAPKTPAQPSSGGNSLSPSQTSGGTGNPTNTPSSSSSGGGNNIAMIAGIAGGVLAILALGIFVFFRKRRTNLNSKPYERQIKSDSSIVLQTVTHGNDAGERSLPPLYQPPSAVTRGSPTRFNSPSISDVNQTQHLYSNRSQASSASERSPSFRSQSTIVNSSSSGRDPQGPSTDLGYSQSNGSNFSRGSSPHSIQNLETQPHTQSLHQHQTQALRSPQSQSQESNPYYQTQTYNQPHGQSRVLQGPQQPQYQTHSNQIPFNPTNLQNPHTQRGSRAGGYSISNINTDSSSNLC